MRLGVGVREMRRAWVWVSVSDCGRRGVGVQPWLTWARTEREYGPLRGKPGVGERHVGVYEGRSEQVVM